jgi:hypothetical protein
MKVTLWALKGAVAATLVAVPAYAQSLRQPASVQNTAYDYEYHSYYAQDDATPSPSDQVAPETEEEAPATHDAAPGCAAEPACGCDTGYCDTGCCDSGCGCGDGWLHLGGLLDPCCTLGEPCGWFDDCCWLESRGMKMYGWIGQSFTWNTTNPQDRFNGPVTMTDRSNEWQLNQLYLITEKETVSECGEWDLGGRVDFLYGTDNRFTTAAGLETEGFYQDPKWTSYRFYGLAMPQLYAEVRKGDFSAKIGHFYSPVGNEVVPMTGNFFPSLPYTFTYGEPFTHTGVLANYDVSEDTYFGGGVTRGWDNWGGGELYRNPHMGGLGTFGTKVGEGNVAFVWVFGPEATLAGNFENRFLQTFVYSRDLEDNWSMILQSDFGFQNDGVNNGTAAQNGDAYWYGVNGYLFKKISDCWTWGMRAEWFRDQDGARVGGYMGQMPNGSDRGLPNGRFGYAGNFYEISIGANYRPNANWNIRPYVRFDWFDGEETFNNTDGKPFDDGNGNSQTLIGFDAIYTY